MSFLPDDAESSDASTSSSSYAPSAFQGYLQKKSPKGFLGKHLWQRRFFVLEQTNGGSSLSYYKDKQQWAKGEKPIGVVRVDMIRDIQLPVESAHYGFRFDILAVGGHLFELMAPSEKSCTQWVRALREEIGKRQQSVNDALRMVKDEHVADGFWKSKGADEVKQLHSHAEAATGGKASRAGSRSHSRSNSRSRAFEQDDEEARERAAALAVMMQEEDDKRTKADGGKPGVKRATSIPASAGSTPPSASAPVEEDKTDEEKAQDFLKQQYTLGAVKAGGRSALRASIVANSALQLHEIEAALPASQKGAAMEIAQGNSASEKGLKRSQSSNGTSASSPQTPSGPQAVGANGAAPQRRPIASYGDDDSDNSDSDFPASPPRGMAAADLNNTPVVRYHADTDEPKDLPPPSSSPSSNSTAAAASAAAAANNDSPFISTILWKESPSGIFKIWQKRLFALQDGVVCYYKTKDGGLKKNNLAGTIPIHQITKVALASDSKKPTDFNLYTSEGRIYKLRSESEDITRQWIAFIQACDPKRLGCNYPGMVVRESRGDVAENAANGVIPTRGRLVANTSGKTVVSILNTGEDTSGVHTAPLPKTASEKAAAEEIVEEKTFWNFLRNKHSMLSIFFVKKKAAFPRVARWFLFILDLLMNLFFVYVFIIDGHLSPVEQVAVIIVILIAIEMVIAWFLKWFCYDRSLGPIEQQVRLGVCAAFLIALFVGLTAWQWTLLPESSAIIALVRFIASSIGVILLEIAVWFFLYSCAQECCPCVRLDDGSKSLDDIQAEEEEKARAEREVQRKAEVDAKRAKMKKKLELKRVRGPEEEV